MNERVEFKKNHPIFPFGRVSIHPYRNYKYLVNMYSLIRYLNT